MPTTRIRASCRARRAPRGWTMAAGRPARSQDAPCTPARRRAPRETASQRPLDLLEVALALLHRVHLLVAIADRRTLSGHAIHDRQRALLRREVARLLQTTRLRALHDGTRLERAKLVVEAGDIL